MSKAVWRSKLNVLAGQETDLRWHYRSRDERLINFSNQYYELSKYLKTIRLFFSYGFTN